MATPRSYIERQTSIFTLDDVTALQPLSPPDVPYIKKLFWLSSFFNQLFVVQDPLEKCQENSPLPVLGNSVHISFTPSNTMLQWRSKAFTLPSSFLLFLNASSVPHDKSRVLGFTCSWSELECCSWQSQWGPSADQSGTPPAPSVPSARGSSPACSWWFCFVYSGEIFLMINTQTFGFVSRSAMAPGRESFSVCSRVVLHHGTVRDRGRRLGAGAD